jgi:subtilase-type serine protease
VESGAGAADLDFNGTNADSLTSSLGARASARIDTDSYGAFVPEAHAIWQHEYLDDRAKVGVAFTESPGGRFTIVSSRFGADTGLLGVGVSHDAGSNVTVFVNYDAQLQSNFTSHTISAGLRVKF